MTYILILILWAPGLPATSSSVEFATQASCKEAQYEIEAQAARSAGPQVRAYCFARGQ
jgi:hypothetical protein